MSALDESGHAVTWREILSICGPPKRIAKSEIDLRGFPDAYLAFVIPHLVLSVVAAFWSNRTYHKILVIFWPLFTIDYLSVTTLSLIAT